MPSGEIFVAGEWRRGQGRDIRSVFAADGTENLTFKGAAQSDADDAVDGAATAQKAWGALKPFERARHLYRIADAIEADASRLAYIQMRDTSKSLRETTALVRSAAGTFRYFAAVAETHDEQLTSARGEYLSLSVHEPLGVVAGITPWNSPIASDAQKAAPALAAGNAIILKPSSWAPLTSLALAEIVEQAGLPAGLFSVLPGSGSEVGNRLVEHPDVAKVSFTGGTSTGLKLAEIAARKLMPISLELGGKSPTIVFEDADIDLAIAGILFGVFSSTGQSCIAGSRLFVAQAIYGEFMDRLVTATRQLRIGHPEDPRTQVAPMVHADQRASVAGFVEAAREEGGRVLCGGRAPEGPHYADGTYFEPTIIDEVSNDALICREEVFGPVLAAMPFSGDDEVIARANDNAYGLACGLWTRDLPRAWRVARSVTSGTVWVNTYKQFSISAPFGGEGMSGMGREKGRQGLLAYMAQKSVYLDTSGAPHPWADWPPAGE
nr:aldehyde dehydrogenase family protein [Cucumibacter marinus]